MATIIPKHFRLAFKEDDIRRRVTEVANEITPWAAEVYQKSGKQVLGVCILRGGVHFFSDLMLSIGASVEFAFCRTWSYSSATNQQDKQGVRVSMEDVVAEGRSILVVDDICDTGATLLKLHNVFRDLGANEVKTAVLIHRELDSVIYEPNWTCFRHKGPEWFVGYGMDDKNTYSNLPQVYTLPQ